MTADPRAMVRAAAERTLSGLEPLAQQVIQEALDQVAAEYAASLQASLVADGDPVDDSDARRLLDLWLARIPEILAALLAVYGASGAAAWRWLLSRDADPARRSRDLVDAYLKDPATLPERVRAYLETAEKRLRDVGDDLWKAARKALADGVAAGDSMDQLRDRLQATFAEGGVELGEGRAQRIARTEVLAAWSSAAMDEARTVPAEYQPRWKEWLATLDLRTRPAHFVVDGTTVPIDAPFMVGGEQLRYPGDPHASAGNVVNCRCALLLKHSDDEPASDQGRQFLSDEEIAEVIADFEERGYVREKDITAASGGPYTGGMVALVPSQPDIDRLAVAGGELAEDLHLTLLFLGDVDGIGEETRAAIVDRLRQDVPGLRDGGGPVEGNGFALSVFNPNSDERDTCIVLGVGGQDLADVHRAVVYTVGDVYDPPEQHAPWVPHVTLTYTDDLSQVARLVDRTGPIVFDRLRVAFGGEVVDIPLDSEGADMPDRTAAAPSPRRWSTPGDTALAFEDQETGDGRIFAPRALYWDGESWPLQYAPKMNGGHSGAVLVGEIQQVNRVGGRITGTGVVYGQDAGLDVIQLLDQAAPLGVSVDLDDVDVEFVDRRPPEVRAPEAGDDGVVLLASLKQASVMMLPDGGWSVRATQVVEWTTGDKGVVNATGLRAALTAAGLLTAAAGDGDDKPGEVLFAEQAGDFVMRITRARLRGATLVTVPAFANACITLDPPDPGEHSIAASDGLDELTASALAGFQAMPRPPASWFREPTAAELPPGSGGVHYANGRIYGWVAQAGVPHEGYPGRNLTIESLGDIDTTAFLRTWFELDDGSRVRVGAFTMNAPHHRDGAECESSACQFDDTRTVAGIVTVGMNAGGMWFSGAAAPWLSDWDRMVFQACQPSYHMRQEAGGRWALRAVLSVPVPGHPSRLAAAAVVDRANLALTASTSPMPARWPVIDERALAVAVVDEMDRRAAARAEVERLVASLAPVRAEIAASTAAQIKEA
ncbi:phage minor head protein [Microtetraspora malaysiensis]|uniref:Phage minor head protein n=1 Tax=Microtetraspora malaysiensis TaxID=161358 RepID=A0ABW6SNN5_9ACTN